MYAVQAGLKLTLVAQAGLELAPILLPQPPKCWDYRREPPRPALFIYSFIHLFLVKVEMDFFLKLAQVTFSLSLVRHVELGIESPAPVPAYRCFNLLSYLFSLL